MEYGMCRISSMEYLKVEQNMLYRTLRMEYNKCGMECGMIVSNIENVEWN